MLPKNKHILIVDDSPNIRRLLVEGLGRMGFLALSEAENAVDAMAKLKRSAQTAVPVEFVISDLNMPGPSGLDFLQLLREEEPFKNLPFLMVTTEGEKGIIVQAAVKGVSGFVVKPFNFQTLEEKMNRAWAKHFP